MEYIQKCVTSKEFKPEHCKTRRSVWSLSKPFNDNNRSKSSRTFVIPRTLLQRTHFHEGWREHVLLVIFMMLMGSLQVTMGVPQAAFLPSYSEYTSTFETVNPDSLHMDGLNVCPKERLMSALDVLPRRKILKDCESMDVFHPSSCRAMKNRRITITDLFVRVTIVECCDGWLQGVHSCTERCPPGTYGPGCRLTCRCAGQVQLGCHHVTGDCFCPAGRAGKVCETTCPIAKKSYGPKCSLRCPTCRHGGVCDPISGECLCSKGFTGRNCLTPDTCIGVACPINCAECDNESTCDVDLGICLCNPGWRGRYCTEPCPAGTYGSDCQQMCRCLHGGICLSEDGACVCPTGWIGAHCETACPESYWGDQCENRCECPNNQCDPFTGECRCPRGRIGPMCVEECPLNTYGKNCAKKCSCMRHYDCDPVSGVCYLVRPIITTTPAPIITNATTPLITEQPTTIPTTPDDDDFVSTFMPVYPVATTQPPVSKNPSGLSTQVVLGTSLGGVLVLAVLLTIAFVWIVFQRRDNTKSGAKPISDLKTQNKNNNSEVPSRPGSTPSAASRIPSPTPSEINRSPVPRNFQQGNRPPITPRKHLGGKPKIPPKPKILAKPIKILSMKMSNFGREPVYETADMLLENDANQGEGLHHSYCDPKTSFNNPFYSAKKDQPPTRMSVPDSLRRVFQASPFCRAATIHSSRGTAKATYHRGRGYEVPNCDIELKQQISKRFSISPPPPAETGHYGGYLELSGERNASEGLYIGLIRNENNHMT